MEMPVVKDKSKHKSYGNTNLEYFVIMRHDPYGMDSTILEKSNNWEITKQVFRDCMKKAPDVGRDYHDIVLSVTKNSFNIGTFGRTCLPMLNAIDWSRV